MTDQRGGGISWTDETWNPIRGCSRVSEGCRNCYAERTAATRMSKPWQAYHGLVEWTPAGPRWTGKVQLVEPILDQPLRWTRPRRVFVNSMSDLFHETIPEAWIDQIVAVMAKADRHQFQVLTKRPHRMADYLTKRLNRSDSFTASLGTWPLPNVWWGTSVEDQATFDKRGRSLMQCRKDAAILWLSMEPLLNPVRPDTWAYESTRDGTNFGNILTGFRGHKVGGWDSGVRLDWVVVGGESGPGARAMDPEWVRVIRDECLKAGVPFHFKQWGEWAPIPAEDHGWYRVDQQLLMPHGDLMARVGKHAAGRELDGQIHDEFPA